MTAVAPDTLAGTASSANLGPAGSAASVASVRPVNGQTVGVGHPIIVTFTHAVADRSAAEQTITVTYQAWRGEPRGKLADAGAGDCIECMACVQVCPTGIDIRDGHQLQCIDCSLCVDACDSMMTKVGRPTGLIAWESFTGQKQKAAGVAAEWRPIRPRTVLYAVVMLLVAAVMMIALVMRQPLKVTMQHDRQPLFVKISGNRLRNGYVMKINNQTRKQQTMMLTVEGPPGILLAVAGENDRQGNNLLLDAAPDGQTSFHLTATVPAEYLVQTATPINFRLSSPDYPEMTISDAFFAPERRPDEVPPP
jgi:cytochrome c oxidase accessory protein FixG